MQGTSPKRNQKPPTPPTLGYYFTVHFPPPKSSTSEMCPVDILLVSMPTVCISFSFLCLSFTRKDKEKKNNWEKERKGEEK